MRLLITKLPWYLWLFVLLIFGFGYYELNSSPLSELAKTATKEELQKGKELFIKNCASCHGSEAIGENQNSPKGGVKNDDSYLAPALNGTGHAWHHSDTI